MPHYFVVLYKIVGIAGERGIRIEGDFKPGIGKLLHHVKHVPPRFHFVRRVFDRLNKNIPELLTPMIEALLFAVPTGDGRISAAPFVVSAIPEMFFRQYRTPRDFIVRPSLDFRNDVLTNGEKVFWDSPGYSRRTSSSVMPTKVNFR